MPSDAVIQKAQRMLDDGRVQPVEGAEVVLVSGDSDTYLVVLVGDVGHCTCPAQSESPCSHMLAADRFDPERDAEPTACSIEQLWERL